MTPWESPFHPMGQEQRVHSAAAQPSMLMFAPNPREVGGHLPIQEHRGGWILGMEKVGEATQFMSFHRGERALTPPKPPGSGVSRKTYFSDSASGGARPACRRRAAAVP